MAWKIKINPEGPLFHAEERKQKMEKMAKELGFDEKPKPKPMPVKPKPKK